MDNRDRQEGPKQACYVTQKFNGPTVSLVKDSIINVDINENRREWSSLKNRVVLLHSLSIQK